MHPLFFFNGSICPCLLLNAAAYKTPVMGLSLIVIDLEALISRYILQNKMCISNIPNIHMDGILVL